MSGVIGLLQQGAFLAFILTLAGATASSLLYPLVTPALRRLVPERRAALLLLWCLLPLLASLFIVFLALLPSLLHLVGLGTDHCLGHAEGHLHLCLVHTRQPVDSLPIWLGALLYAGWVALAGTHLICRLLESLRLRQRLLAYPQRSHGGIRLLRCETPLALNCGLGRQDIFLSTGLTEVLTDAERHMIIAHERSHLRRRDSGKLLLARAFSLAHFPGLRGRLLRDLELAAEQACDRAAALADGDPLRVAQLLLKVERLYRQHFSPAAPAAPAILDADTSCLPRRIDALLALPPDAARGRWIAMALLVLAGVLVLGHATVHDVMEHLTAFFME